MSTDAHQAFCASIDMPPDTLFIPVTRQLVYDTEAAGDGIHAIVSGLRRHPDRPEELAELFLRTLEVSS